MRLAMMSLCSGHVLTLMRTSPEAKATVSTSDKMVRRRLFTSACCSAERGAALRRGVGDFKRRVS
jgi:hypothetical protein